MLTAEIEQLGLKGLTVAFATKLNALHIGLSGSCDRQALPHLAPFLNDLHEEARRLGVQRVVIDCENFYFMSSTCIKSFVGWMAKLKALPAQQRYVVEFRINKRLGWQQRTLSAVTRFAPDLAYFG